MRTSFVNNFYLQCLPNFIFAVKYKWNSVLKESFGICELYWHDMHISISYYAIYIGIYIDKIRIRLLKNKTIGTFIIFKYKVLLKYYKVQTIVQSVTKSQVRLLS